MTSDELRAACDTLGISQRQLARNLEIPQRLVRHYAAADEPIPRCVSLAIGYLIAHPEEILP